MVRVYTGCRYINLTGLTNTLQSFVEFAASLVCFPLKLIYQLAEWIAFVQA